MAAGRPFRAVRRARPRFRHVRLRGRGRAHGQVAKAPAVRAGAGACRVRPDAARHLCRPQGALQGTGQAASPGLPWRRQGGRGASQDHQPGLYDAEGELFPFRLAPTAWTDTDLPTTETDIPMASPQTSPVETPLDQPDITVSVRQTFGLDSDMQVPAFSRPDDHVPELDEAYRFDHDTTLAILAGFAYNRRVLIQGYHGTGKSTHIEQVAARLNWPCIRVNLDSHISRIDLVGKDAI